MSATPGQLDFAAPAVPCMEYPVQLTLRRMCAQTGLARASQASLMCHISQFAPIIANTGTYPRQHKYVKHGDKFK